MRLLSWLLGRNEERSAPLSDSVGFFGAGGFNDSGVAVNEMMALTASSVYACCKILSEAVAQLPVHVFAKQEGRKLYEHPVARLLAAEPNEFMTAASFREAMMLNLALWGNCYAFIDRDSSGVPVGLYPLRSDQTRPVRQNGLLFYTTRIGGVTETLTPDRVLHILNFSLDGITGISPIQQAKQNVGLSIALERFAAKLFSNGGNVGGVLKVPPMKEDAIKNFVASWKANYAGLENAFRVAVLPDGYDFKQTTINPEQGQMKDARIHQVLEVARLYRIPPHMVGVLEKASYASIEMQSMDFYQGTIQPIVTRWEQELTRKLLLEAEKPTHEVRFNLDAMLRASTKERLEAYAVAINNGIMTRAECRAKENLPFIPGSDNLLQPLNMQPVNAPTPAPKPSADPAATRSLLDATVRRFVTKEAKAVARAARKHQNQPDELRAWATEFYASHEPLVVEILTPALRAAGLTSDPADIAKRHCSASLALIGNALAQKLTTDELTEDLEDRASDLVDDLLGGSEDVRTAA